MNNLRKGQNSFLLTHPSAVGVDKGSTGGRQDAGGRGHGWLALASSNSLMQ